MSDLLVTLGEIRAAADVIGDSDDASIYIDMLNDIYRMTDDAIVSAETTS